jgi:endo-alpha-1,4-polygalactosaminidase (GH114 family)
MSSIASKSTHRPSGDSHLRVVRNALNRFDRDTEGRKLCRVENSSSQDGETLFTDDADDAEPEDARESGLESGLEESNSCEY